MLKFQAVYQNWKIKEKNPVNMMGVEDGGKENKSARCQPKKTCLLPNCNAKSGLSTKTHAKCSSME